MLLRLRPNKRFPIRLLTIIAGIALLAFIVERAGPTTLLQHVVALRWALALIIVLGGISHALRTWGWQLALGNHKDTISFLRLAGLRLIAEAAGQLGFVGQMFGDAIRVKLLRERMPMANLISSVTLDRGLFMIAGATISVAGLVTAVFLLPLPHGVMLLARMFIVSIVVFLAFSAIAIRRRFKILSGTARLISRLPWFATWIQKRSSSIQSVEQQLMNFYSEHPIAFWAAFTVNLGCHVIAVLEIYVILLALGLNMGLFTALFIEALTKLVNVAGALNPGNIGTYEGGNMLILKLLRINPTFGLTLGLTRRLRGLFWAAVGGLWLIAAATSRKPKCMKKVQQIPTPAEPGANPSRASRVAVVLAKEQSDSSAVLTRIGTLPVLLRVILGVRRAGVERIFVLLNEGNKDQIQSVLMNTGRVPKHVEWITTQAGTPLSYAFQSALKQARACRVIVVSGDRTYHPALIRKVVDSRECDTNVLLNTDEKPAGIYLLSDTFLLRSEFRDVRELDAALAVSENLTCLPVEQNLWHRVTTINDCAEAERKLNRWLVKPTDGFFAQMNRIISIPISRQLIRFPITPNMVSLFVLGVSFSSGVFFALGGYLNILAGALLSVAASILDGCDGEVARLKLQDSAFGCWLETICDYLYYVFIFVGLTLGLMRSSGSNLWLVWGGVLLFGAVMTFMATAFSRHRLAQRRPEDLLRIWQSQAESRKSNPLLFIGRRTEFLVRRCFMPYALLGFAVLNLTKLTLILCAVGSNVAWIVSLYSCFVFSACKRRAAATPTPAAAT